MSLDSPVFICIYKVLDVKKCKVSGWKIVNFSKNFVKYCKTIRKVSFYFCGIVRTVYIQLKI